MNAHDVLLAKVIINIQCETLFPKHNSRVVCTGIHIYKTMISTYILKANFLKY